MNNSLRDPPFPPGNPETEQAGEAWEAMAAKAPAVNRQMPWRPAPPAETPPTWRRGHRGRGGIPQRSMPLRWGPECAFATSDAVHQTLAFIR